MIELNEISGKCQAMNKLQANCWTPTRGVLSSVFVNYLSGTERKSSWDFLHFPKFEQHRIYEQRNWFVKLFCGSAQHPQSYSALWRGGSKENSTETLFFLAALQHTHENDGHSNPHRRVQSTYDIMNVAAPPVTGPKELVTTITITY